MDKTHRTFYIHYNEVRLQDLKLYISNKGLALLEKNFYIEYKIGDANRNEKLKTLILKLKEEKEKYFKTGTEPSREIEDWIKYLDSDPEKWFNKIELKGTESNVQLIESFGILSILIHGTKDHTKELKLVGTLNLLKN